MHMTLPHFVQSLGDAPLLCSVAGGAPRFTSSLGGHSLALLSHWRDAPSLRSVTGGCSLTSFSCWGCSSLRFVAGGTLPCFAQSLGGCSPTSFSCWGMLPRFAQPLGGRSIALLSRFPFNGSIKLLQKFAF